MEYQPAQLNRMFCKVFVIGGPKDFSLKALGFPWNNGDLPYFFRPNFHALVGGFKHEFDFPFHIWDVILPIDELHHFSEG